jgi:hypothetical protein
VRDVRVTREQEGTTVGPANLIEGILDLLKTIDVGSGFGEEKLN